MGFEAKIQQKINAYRQTHPKVKMSDEQIVSILVKNGEIVLSEDQKRSLFANNSKQNNNTGLKLEKTNKKPNPEKTIYLQSGRKVVYSKLSNGKTVMKYYGADGSRINPDYFKKVEGQISISADGNSYTVTKNGKKQTLKAKNPTQGAIDQNIAKLNNQEKALNKAKKEQGWIGKGWDWFKNNTGIGDGSDKAQQQIDAERKLLKQVKTGKISKKDFKEVTGQDYTKENLAKFQKGELSQAETKINGYKEGQDMATDMVGDMVSGIAAVGIYTAAIAATPFTGGASLLVGFGLATASGAAIKVGIKALDTVGTDKKYTLKDCKHDAATGAFSGALAPLTAGLGGAVGKTVATKFGVQAIKTVGKEVAEEAAKGGVKSTLKAALANPAGYEYVGGTFAKRTTSMAAEMATDGALGGAIDGGFRAGLDSDWDAETMLEGAVEGGVGGALFAPAIGGGMKALGKGAQKAFGKDNVKIDANGNKVADEAPTIPDAQGAKESSKGKVLEGGIKDTELDEVAPFAQRLEKAPSAEDLTNPEVKTVKLENGEFNANGEFVPDGTYTKAESGKVLSKKETFKKYPEGDKKLASNIKELIQQYAGMRKPTKHDINIINRLVKEHPELSIQEHSELLHELSILTNGRSEHTNFLTDFYGLRSTSDFKTFKTNLEEFNKFYRELKDSNADSEYVLYPLKNMRTEYFSDNMSKIKSEDFKRNLEMFKGFTSRMQDGGMRRDQLWLFTTHTQKEFDNMNFANDFNKWADLQEACGKENVVRFFSEPFSFAKLTDEKMAQVRKNVELVKTMIEGGSRDTRTMCKIIEDMGYTSNYTDLYSRIKTEIGDGFDMNNFSRLLNSAYVENGVHNYDFGIQFAKKLPKQLKEFGAWEISKMAEKFAKADKAGQDEILARLSILSKFSEFDKYEKIGKYDVEYILNDDMPNALKIAEFLENAEPSYVEHLSYNYQNNYKHISIEEMLKDNDLDVMIANAKLHKELPQKLLERLNKNQSTLFYDVEPDVLKQRIEVINKYQDKFTPAELHNMYSGNFVAKDDVMNMLAGLNNTKLRESFIYGGTGEKLNQLDKKTLDIFKDYVNNCEITERDAYDFSRNFYDFDFGIFNLLSKEELDAIPFRHVTNLAQFDIEAKYGNMPTTLECIQHNVAATPKKIRDFVKNHIGYEYYKNMISPENTVKQARAIQILEKLSDEDLQAIGPQAVSTFLDKNVCGYSTTEFNSNNLNVWKQLDKDIKDKFESAQVGDKVYEFLTSNNKYDLSDINAKVAKLKEQGIFENIDSRSLDTLLRNKSKEMKKVFDEIVSDKNFNKDDINYLISNLDCLKGNGINDWDYISNLLKKKVDASAIPDIIRALSLVPEIRTAQKDFADYMIARGDIEAPLVARLLTTVDDIKFRGAKQSSHPSNAVKTELAKELFDNPNIENNEITNILYSLNQFESSKEHPISVLKDFITDLINKKKYSTSDISEICGYLRNRDGFFIQNHADFAFRLLNDNKLETSKAKEILRHLHGYENKKCADTVMELTDDILANYRNINNENLVAIASSISYHEENAELQAKFAKELLADRNVNQDCIASMVSSTDCWFDYEATNRINTSNKIDFIKELIKNPNIEQRKIAGIIAGMPNDNFGVTKDLVVKLVNNRNVDQDDISRLVRLMYTKDIAPEVMAQKIYDFAASGLDRGLIEDICSNASKLSIFNDDVVAILKRIKTENPSADIGALIRNITDDVFAKKLEDKIDTLLSLTALSAEDKLVFKKQGVDIDAKMRALMQAIDAKRPIITTTKDDVKTFLKHVGNNGKADDVIRNANLEKFGKDGIQLEYSRDEFIQNMDKIIKGSGAATKEIDTSNTQIPDLILHQNDIKLTAEKIASLRATCKTEEVEVILDGVQVKGTRFLGTQGGSNKAYYTQIGDKLYYIKYPDSSKLGQSVEEVVAANLYRAAGIDSPNMKYIYDKNGHIIGMAGEYVPDMSMTPRAQGQATEGFAADAWLANWDAPKNDNTQYRANGVIKVDVGGSLRYRARGEMKNFGNIVDELSTLIEQNSKFLTMTKDELLASLKHVTDMPEDRILKIIQDSPLDDASLAKTLLKRKEYMTIFAEKLKTLDERNYKNILDMVNEAKALTAQDFRDDANIAELLGYTRTKTGFEGMLNNHIPDNVALSAEEKALADKMIAEINKFTKNNRIADNVEIEPETREFLNSILKGIPEFAAYFGKPQHSLQKYSLDVHILKVMQDSMKDPLYKELGDVDKLVLKFTTLLHDVGKRYLLEGSDTGHAAMSAEYVYSILDRFNLTQDVKNRIIANIENHHWFKEYNLGHISPETVAALCRRPEDFKIYQIMAKADLKNVNDTFYMRALGVSSMEDADARFAEKMAEIAPYVQKLQEKQVVVTPSVFKDVPERVTSNGRVIAARTFPTEKTMLNGVDTEFKVLNLTTLKQDTNMQQFGFNNISLQDVRLMVHMLTSKIDMDVFKTLSNNPMNNSAQSISMISMADKSTYGGRQFGLVLDVENANISHAYYANTASGTQKGLGSFVRELFEDGEHRSFVKDKFKSFLKSKDIEISDSEYAAIANVIMSKKYPETQIKDINIGTRTFKGEDIQKAFTYSRDQLIDVKKMKTHGMHNELVGMNTQVRGIVAKVKSLNDCPNWFLEFAKENNLPIILIGNQ